MKTGLALGGGGARGLGHIPVLYALEELGIQPMAIAGSSIGALIGAGLASGMQASDLEDYFIATFSRSSEVMTRLWALKPTSWTNFWERGFRLSQFNLERILDSFLPADIPQNFEDLKVPFTAVAGDLKTATMMLMNHGDLRSALAASAAIPGLFKPVKRDDRLLIDGGICNPVPFDGLMQPVDCVIAVDVIGFPGLNFDGRDPSTLESLMAASLVSQQAIVSARLQLSKPDLLLRPPVSGIYVLDFLKSKEIFLRLKPYKEEAKRAIALLMESKDVEFSARICQQNNN